MLAVHPARQPVDMHLFHIMLSNLKVLLLYHYTLLTSIIFKDENVYSIGLIAELTGSTNTMTQAYTSPEMTVPFRAAKPKVH